MVSFTAIEIMIYKFKYYLLFLWKDALVKIYINIFLQIRSYDDKNKG